MPVLILAGDEEFELSRAVVELKESLLDAAWATLNFQCLQNPTIREIIDVSASLPFGPGNKVILIDKCDLFTRKRKGSDAEESAPKSEKGRAAELERFEQAMANVAANTFVIFSSPHNFDTTLKTSKAVSKHAQLKAFTKPKYFPGTKNADLERWCRKEAKLLGATIDSEAIYYLLDGTDCDLRQVSAEITKASIHIMPATHITLDVVTELSPYHSHVFALAEQWLTGRTKESLASAREMLSRQSAMPILATLQTLLSKWIYMKALCDRYNGEVKTGPGINRRELPLPELTKRVAAQLKAHPFVVEKDLRRIQPLATTKLLAKREQLIQLEALVKTGQMPEQHALELFLVS